MNIEHHALFNEIHKIIYNNMKCSHKASEELDSYVLKTTETLYNNMMNTCITRMDEGDLVDVRRYIQNECLHLAVRTPTKDIYDRLVGILEIYGLKWQTGGKYSDVDHWYEYRHKTLLLVGLGQYTGSEDDPNISHIVDLPEFELMLIGNETEENTNPNYHEFSEGPKATTEEPPKDTASVLLEAESLVNGDRAKAYGPATKSFKRIADISTSLMTEEELNGNEITDIMICKILVALKLARQINSHKRDNLVDLAGYASLWNEIENAKR